MWLPPVNRLPDSNSIFSSLWLTDDSGMQFLCRNFPLPWSQSPSPSLSLSFLLSPPSPLPHSPSSSLWTGWRAALILAIVLLEFESYFSWSGPLDPAANPLQQTEWPPHSSLEINSSQDLRGPARPDMKRRWYLWYGMLSRNLFIKLKHARPRSWPRTKPLTSWLADFSRGKSFLRCSFSFLFQHINQ